jgi:hypothetical protein
VSGVRVSYGSTESADGPRIEIMTRVYDSGLAELIVARQILARSLESRRPDLRARSNAAFALAQMANDWRSRREALLVTPTRQRITLDAERASFTCLKVGSDWAGVSRAAEVVIAISARGINCDAVKLTRIVDPADSLAIGLPDRP